MSPSSVRSLSRTNTRPAFGTDAGSEAAKAIHAGAPTARARRARRILVLIVGRDYTVRPDGRQPCFAKASPTPSPSIQLTYSDADDRGIPCAICAAPAKIGEAMWRRLFLAIVVWFILTPASQARSGPRLFRWQKGAILSYRVEHVTSAAETVGETKSETNTKLSLTKRWEVLDVGASGVATLQLSLTALRLETTSP